MTDDELVQRLRRLAQPGDAPDWDAMAADVRTAYEAATATAGADRRSRVRRRWLAAPAAGLMALAAAVTLYVRAHHATIAPTLDDEALMMDEADPDELIDELTPAQLDRVAQALDKGA